MTRDRILLIAAALFGLISPFLGIPGWTPSLATVAALVAISLIGLNIIFGYCGMLALGQAAFAVIPAYASGILTTAGVPVWISGLTGLALTIAIARALAGIFIRLPGIYLAVGTLGFAYVVEGLARAFPAVTGGASGLVLTLPFVPSEAQWYLISVIALGLAILVTAHFLRGATARALRLVNRDELAASVYGIDVVKLKTRVFSIGAAYSAVGGLLLAYYTSVVTPEMGGANTSLEYLAMVVIGGAGFLSGPIIGAIAINWLFAIAGAAARYELLVYGASFLAVILFAPGGIAGLIRKYSRSTERHSERVVSTPDLVPPLRASQQRLSTGLKATCISKRFGGLTAVQGVDLSVAHGEIVGLLGPNGAGKSTFFNILSGIEQADTGEIHLNGRNISKLTIHERAAIIGRSFQVPRLVMDMTVLQNVVVRVDQLHPETPEDKKTAIAIAELQRFGLAKFAYKKAGEVAVGHHKLIDIARASVGSPPLVLLDEPAVGLTAAELESLKSIIQDLLAGGSAIVVVDHNIDFITSIAHRILVMEGGKPIAFGSPRDVIESPRVREAYLGVLA